MPKRTLPVFIGEETGSKRLFGTGLDTFHTENAFRSVFSASCGICDIDLHGADALTFSARDAFRLVAFYSEKRKIAHRLQKNRDRTNIFAERPIVP